MSNIEVKLDTESAQPVPVVAPTPEEQVTPAPVVPPVVPEELPQRVEPIQPSGVFLLFLEKPGKLFRKNFQFFCQVFFKFF